MSAPIDILAIGAHPDDAEIGCGGALILAADAGLGVAVADLSIGEMATYGTPAEREVERLHAARVLGLRERPCLGWPDTGIGEDTAHCHGLVALIRALRPRILLAPYTEDRHPDHAAAGRLARKAAFLAGLARIGGGAPHRPQRLYHYMIHQPFDPSFVVDVSAVWERRMAAVAAYGSQFGIEGGGVRTEIGDPSFLAHLSARGNFYGALIGANFGEPFYCEGPIATAALPGMGLGEHARGRYRMVL